MIFFFISYAFSKTVYDLARIPSGGIIGAEPISMKIFLQKLDVVEIKVPPIFRTFLDYWKYSKDLFLYVETDSIYGPFDINSGLAGICFNDKDYVIRLVNDGPDNINFFLVFDRYIPSRNLYDLPIHTLEDVHLYELKSPFIYYIDKSGYSYIIVIMTILLAILGIVGLASNGCGNKENDIDEDL